MERLDRDIALVPRDGSHSVLPINNKLFKDYFGLNQVEVVDAFAESGITRIEVLLVSSNLCVKPRHP